MNRTPYTTESPRVGDTGFRPHYPWPSVTSDLEIGTLVVILPDAISYTFSERTGWTGVSIMKQGEIASLICNSRSGHTCNRLSNRETATAEAAAATTKTQSSSGQFISMFGRNPVVFRVSKNANNPHLSHYHLHRRHLQPSSICWPYGTFRVCRIHPGHILHGNIKRPTPASS